MAVLNRSDMIDKINQISFVIDETRLFLDTHSCNKDAMKLYQEMSLARAQAMKEYAELYGPMDAYQTFDGSEWKWADTPWPWEGRC